MSADSYYQIGSSHVACEDYALDGIGKDGLVYAVLADGCSSSKNTDVGARILCHTADRYLKKMTRPFNFWSFMVMAGEVLPDAVDVATRLGLRQTALDATLWLLVRHEGICTIVGYGDGVVVVRKQGGTMTLVREYESGAPYYLSYRNDGERSEAYLEAFGDSRLVETTHGDTSKSTTIRDITEPFLWEIGLERGESVTVFSDGILTYNADKFASEDESTKWIANELTSYKNFTGSFVKRRMRMFSKRHKNMMHHDDLSCVSIAVEK
jgi:hypothetical protein